MLSHTLKTTLRLSRSPLIFRALPVAPLSTSTIRFAAKGTKGAEGQLVDLPDMEAIERVEETPIAIPTAPDSYVSSSSPFSPSGKKLPSSSSLSSKPTPTSASAELDQPSVITASHPSTYPGGGPSLGAHGDDVQEGKEGDSTSSTPKDKDRSRDGYEGERLSEEDRKGLWKLGGIMAVGYVAGLITDPKWRRGETA
ncbi:hypothetical protein JCM8547_005756 [Rhodosporidiobolus lusitaniae]